MYTQITLKGAPVWGHTKNSPVFISRGFFVMEIENSKFDKPFVDFPELVTLLQTRGLKISDTSVAEDLLKKYGYYPVINGFKNFFQSDTNQEQYSSSASLEMMVGEFILDSQFQELFLTSVFQIENHFKNIIGYVVAREFGVNNFNTNDPDNPDPTIKSYLSLDNYNNNGRISVNTEIRYIRKKVLTSLDNPVAYYREHKNHIPPWIMMINMNLGTAVKYYQILPGDLKSEIVNEMISPIDSEDLDKKKALFLSEIEILHQYRNIAAHSSPMYLYRVNQNNNPSVETLQNYTGTGLISQSQKRKGIGTKNLYAALIGLILLTKNQGQRSTIIEKLESVKNSYISDTEDDVYKIYENYLKMAKLPDNYIELLNKANKQLVENNLELIASVTKVTSNGATISASMEPRTPVYSIAQSRKVYITNNGEKYHTSRNCSVIKDHEIQSITITEAHSRGLHSCERCKK